MTLDKSSRIEVVDLQHGAFDFCQQMQCPALIKPEDCDPRDCVRLDAERMRLGAIYLLRQEPSDEADFVTMLPGVRI